MSYILRWLPIALVSLTLIGCANLAYSPTDLVSEVPNSESLTPWAPGPAPPSGLGITQIFLIDLADGSATEIPLDRHIPAAKLAAGGGLQMLRLD